MKKIIFLVLFLIFISGCSDMIKETCFNDICFKVELATNEKEREIGLMNRTFLGSDHGMLFVFDNEDIYSFWMKNTLIPLDIIWINSSNQVVYLKENALPCNLFEKKLYQKMTKCEIFNPNRKSKYVLEINAGMIKQDNIKLNDIVYFQR